MKKVCILIPSYNESKTIGRITGDLKGRGMAVYVVDDGSLDNTADVARSAGAAVFVHDRNLGKGASLIDGFRDILKKDFDAVLIMDGDGQHETGDVEAFLKKFEESNADIIIGNRMSDTASMPFVRKETNKFMSYVISKMCGQYIPDTQCGFKLLKRRVIQGMDLQSSKYEIESEMLLKAAKKGFRIESVPVKTVYGSEKSNINPIIDTIRFFLLLIRISWRRRKG